MSSFARARTTIVLAASLLLAQRRCRHPARNLGARSVLSDLIEVTLAALTVFHCSRASGRSRGLARSFWALAAATFAIALVDFSLMVWSEFFPASIRPPVARPICSGASGFSPLALGMFLDPERETEGLDLLVAVDFLQAGRLLRRGLPVFLFTFPSRALPSSSVIPPGLPIFFAYAFLAAAFWLRSALNPLAAGQIAVSRRGDFPGLLGSRRCFVSLRRPFHGSQKRILV